jgi:septal ring factor EnvC (AmiA/AmiB activator)
VTNFDDQSVGVFLKGTVPSPAVKAALKEAMALKHKVAAGQQELARANQQLQDIGKDQERLRANLKDMPPTADAYKRYLKKFDDQETAIEKLQAQIKQLQQKADQQRTALDTFLIEMTVD